MAEALVFGPTFEALARALGPLLASEPKGRFKALGVNYDSALLPAYPYDTWVRAMDLASSLVLPNTTEAERHAAMGSRLVDSYGETLVGRALLTALRVIGPKRTLERMARNLRTANNYTETRFTVRDDGVCELWCSRVASTHFYRGLLRRGVEVAGGKDVSIECSAHDASGATFVVRWS